MAYYPCWAPPTTIDFTKFDVIDFAFAMPDKDFSLTWENNARDMLHTLVHNAYSENTKIKLSIGGWDGNGHFSRAVSTESNRQTFVNNILEEYETFCLDGIDVDWEYPGQTGDGNEESGDDTKNMLSFLELLRAKLPPSAYITAAVQDQLFAGSNGQPITYASDFAKVLDWVLFMNYDTYETATPPGPNAPLYNGCGGDGYSKENAASAYDAWTKAGFPAHKMVLGIPSYGYVVDSEASELQHRSLPPFSPLRSPYQRRAAQIHEAVGQIQFCNLVSDNLLERNPDGTFSGSGGFQRYWDSCSATPFLRNSESGQVIPYDDPESVGLKAAFAQKMGMRGANLFDIHGDTEQWELVDAIRENLGLFVN
ncbi:glycoside hydrolase family 18 protein [Hygrophoropsis aurantiaca]|uniref:Glycoside hydrolase family 18 protein n=1 Tax=Hygrophoropsis aurantiaca TaxID=72124 RepID=A0ACB8AV15_9AGAM|nr:glycoside hydrolase family 18 protein [Hygrophoropsis aurantiaca]